MGLSELNLLLLTRLPLTLCWPLICVSYFHLLKNTHGEFTTAEFPTLSSQVGKIRNAVEGGDIFNRLWLSMRGKS